VTARALDADDRRARPGGEAEEWGLVNRAVPTVRHGDRWIEHATAEQIRAAQGGKDGLGIDLSRLDAEVAATAGRLLESFPSACATRSSR
jgi:enoyl-CoA hydratase/carnithine racemase